MVIIKTAAWAPERGGSKTKDEKERKNVSDKTSESYLFGFQDLASDYYQVLAERHRPKWCRILWGITFFFLFGFTCFMVYKLLHDFFQYDSFNKIQTKWKTNMTMPAITICATNYINYTDLEKELEDKSEVKTSLISLLTAVEKFSKDGDILSYLDDQVGEDEILNVLDWEIEEGSIPVRFKNHVWDMIVGSSYDYIFNGAGRLIDGSNKGRVIGQTELGSCFELNDNSRMVQTFAGKEGGLTIDLDAKVRDYLFTTSTKGFLVFIRNPDETVMLNEGGILVSPGTEAFMKLKATDVTRLKSPHGTCENIKSQYSKYNTTFETVRECHQRQILNAWVDVCGCFPWFFATRMTELKKKEVLQSAIHRFNKHEQDNPDTRKKRRRRAEREAPTDTEWITPAYTPTEEPIYEGDLASYLCTLTDQVTCNSIMQQKMSKGTLQMKSCPEPCKYTEWDVQMNTASFPATEPYFNAFIKDQMWSSDEADTTYEYATKNLARIHIYYETLKVDVKTQEKAYETQNFIAEFGGTVDLFIGFSFFTVLQVLEIGIAACVLRFSRRNVDDVVEDTRISDIRL